MDRETAIGIYNSARAIFNSASTRAERWHARRIAKAIEMYIGQLGSCPAEAWKLLPLNWRVP